VDYSDFKEFKLGKILDLIFDKPALLRLFLIMNPLKQIQIKNEHSGFIQKISP